MDLLVAMETTEHAEIEVFTSPEAICQMVAILKKRGISKVTSYSLELVICVRLMRV